MAIYKDTTTNPNKWYYKVNSGYTLENGVKKYKQYKSKRYDTKRECEKAQADFILTRSRQKGISKPFDMLCDEWLEEYAPSVKIQTVVKIKRCLTMIKDFYGSKPISKITDEDYRQFRDYLTNYTYKKKDREKTLSDGQLNKIHCYFKNVLKYSSDTYGITYTIPSRYGNFKRVTQAPVYEEYYTIEEVKRLIDATEKVEYKALFTTLAFLGLREGEANALQIRDIKGNTLEINKTVNTKIKVNGDYLISTPKTRKSNRILTMPKIVKDAIYSMIDQWSAYDGFNEEWFVFGGYKALAESSMSKQLARSSQKAGLKRIHLHSLRKSFASMLYNNGVPALVAQEILGHEDIQTTLKVYTKVYQGEKEKAIAVLDSII